LVERLRALEPLRILVWPDNDKAGQEWAPPLYRALLSEGLQVALVDLRPLPLKPGDGCDDFIDEGGDLDQMFQRCFQQVGGFSVDEVIEKIVVTKDERLMMPGSRTLHPIKFERVATAFYRMTQQATPGPKVLQRIQVELLSKSIDSGVEVFYR